MVAAAPSVTETVAGAVEKSKVPAVDLRRVRFAVGITVALAVIDLCLYLPRLF
jgi:hypothetical protein